MATADEGEHTAALLIRIYPAGTSGQVYVTVTDQGPATLTNGEVLRTLRTAIEVVEDRELSTETTSLLRGLASAEGSGMTEIEPGRFYVDKQLPPPVPRRLAP